VGRAELTVRRWMLPPVRHCQGGELPVARWTGTTTQRGYRRRVTTRRPLAKTADRGYGGPHQKLRAQWKPLVDAGRVSCHAAICLKPSRQIIPGTPWDLGHTPDRSAWTGPEHQECNRADGNRSQRRRQRQRRTVMTTSRNW
jgi:hypothetical protein